MPRAPEEDVEALGERGFKGLLKDMRPIDVKLCSQLGAKWKFGTLWWISFRWGFMSANRFSGVPPQKKKKKHSHCTAPSRVEGLVVVARQANQAQDAALGPLLLLLI